MMNNSTLFGNDFMLWASSLILLSFFIALFFIERNRKVK